MVRFLLISILLIVPFKVYSHGGGLNKEGCHNNRSTGNYHCHRDSKDIRELSQSEKTSIDNESLYNSKLAKYLGGITEVAYNYDYNINGSTSRIEYIIVDIVTDKYVIEGGLDERNSLDSIQQAVFASTISGKTPAIAIYDTNGSWDKYEHRMYTSAKALGIKFFWVSGNEIKELN